MKTFVKLLIVGLLIAAAISLFAEEPASLNISTNSIGEVILKVVNGTNNVQYMLWTSPDNTITSTNWYYWNRAYPLHAFVVFNPLATTNQAAGKPMRFFQIRGVLPD